MSLWDKKRQIEALAQQAAEVQGELTAAVERLNVVEELESVKKQLMDAKIELDRVQETNSRKERETEHKLGLHRIQVEQERAAAVTEAKLAVREEALTAQEGRFAKEMEFMQGRFEQEVASQRRLVEQVLDRLPHFTHSRVEHIGTEPVPTQRLEIENK